jgi:hypothetical protein
VEAGRQIGGEHRAIRIFDKETSQSWGDADACRVPPENRLATTPSWRRSVPGYVVCESAPG